MGDLYQALVDDYRLHEQHSVRNVEGAWSNHLKPAFGACAVIPFRPSKVKEYITARKAASAAKATINRELSYLKRMCALAVENHEAERADPDLISNLMRWSKIKALDESDNVREQMFPNELYDSFAIETARVGLWFRTMFELSFARGWRPKSLKQLKVRQFNPARRTLTLNARQSKNGQACEIGLTDTEFELLRQCCANKKPDQAIITREKDALGRKPRNGGEIVDYRKDWKRVCERVGVEPGRHGFIFYDTKRAGITNFIDSGFDVKEAMTISNHKTESSFRRYQKVSLPKLQEAARRIERAHRERQARARFQQQELFGNNEGRKAS